MPYQRTKHKISMLRLIWINILVFFSIISLAELASGYALNNKKSHSSSLLYAISAIKSRLSSGAEYSSSKIDRVRFLKNKGVKNVYPFYLYDPQAHQLGNKYWLSHPPNSLIIYCDEGDGLLEYKTNKLGFRETENENLNEPIETIMLGDSYTEGACVKKPHDLASILQNQTGRNILNLGRGGSGPLLQLAILQEFFSYVDNSEVSIKDDAEVIWIHFTGNDLNNLAEEKSSILTQYYFDPKFSTSYFNDITKPDIVNGMDSFYSQILKNPAPNKSLGNHNYGETVVNGSVSFKNNLIDYSRIIKRAYALTKKRKINMKLFILSNHPQYSQGRMNATQEVIINTCKELSIECINYDMADKDTSRSHFTINGYLKAGKALAAHLHK